MKLTCEICWLIRNYCNQSDLINSDCMSDIQYIYSVIHMCVLKLLNILHIMVFILNKKIKKLIYSPRYFKKINNGFQDICDIIIDVNYFHRTIIQWKEAIKSRSICYNGIARRIFIRTVFYRSDSLSFCSRN